MHAERNSGHADRNQIRSPNIKFRVYTQNNGECKHEFCIKLKDITWDSFLKNLFGSYIFEENQLPTIILLGNKHKIVLSITNIKQLIRDALEESFRGFTLNLLVPDFENFYIPPTGESGLSKDAIQRKKAEINDFTEIFAKRIVFPDMDQLVQNTLHVRFTKEMKEPSPIELPARENVTQLGELHVQRLNDGDLVKLLKDGASLILQTSDNKMVSMKFCNDQLPTFNETQCKYRTLNLAYECRDLKVPVLIDDNIRFLFNRDADFVQKMKTTNSELDKQHREQMNRLKKLEETMKKIKSSKETSKEPSTSETSAVTIPTPTAELSAPVSAAFKLVQQAIAGSSGIPPASEGSSNEGAQSGSRVHRRPHRMLQKRPKRCSAGAGQSTSAESPNGSHLLSSSTREEIVKAMHDLSLSPSSPHRLSELAAHCYSNSNQVQQSAKPDTSRSIAVGAKQEIPPETPAWFGDLLDKFKDEVLQEVKSLVKDALDTSLPNSSASELKLVREPNQDDEQNYYKALVDGAPSSSAGKHKHHDKHHHGSGSSKRKSGALCSKRGPVFSGVENKSTTYAYSDKVLEISNGLFIYSKSGFKVRMPRNASLTVQINIGKLAKYRNTLEDVDLRVRSVSNSIECCVTRVIKGSGAPKLTPMNKDLSINYDVRIKSKDKAGKFRLYFNVIGDGRSVGHSFKIDVRVKKEFTLPFGNPDFIPEVTFNYDSDSIIRNVGTLVRVPSSSSANFIESQKSAVEDIKEDAFLSNAVAAAVELADEGIGGNQEDFFSPTSDSEYSDMSDSKPDALLKDEGIDTCYRSVMESVTTAAPKCDHPELDFESDTDSSISFLMDENEARDDLNDSLDVVQLPSCFIPNVECNDDVLPVRIKRKNSSASKRAVAKKDDNDSQQQSSDNKPSAFDTNPLTPVAVASAASSSSATSPDKRAACSPAPAVTISDDEEDEDVEFLNESIKSAAVDHAYHRSLYPNLQGLKESVRPTTSSEATTNPEPTTVTPDAKPSVSNPESPKQSAPEPYPHILPEKLFEMWKNAGPLPKQMHNTMSSVFNSVQTEINNAATAARSAAASAAAAAASIVPNVPMPPSPTAPAPWFAKPESFSRGATPAAAAAADPAPSSSNDSNPFSRSQHPEGNSKKNVAFSFGKQAARQQPNPNFKFEPQQQQQQQQQNDNPELIQSMYKNLSVDMQNNLLTLHDMGFTDDPYIIYLLEQFPNDLSKVIESLINYSTY